VGAEAVRLAVKRGHVVTAFVRDPDKFRKQMGGDLAKVAVGDLSKPDSLDVALSAQIEAVVNAVGVDPLKPSTFVTDAARTVTRAMKQAGVVRYVAVSGTACMRKTAMGRVAEAILSMTPVRHALRDHRGAFDIVTHADLVWTLAGCPWIADIPAGRYHEYDIFPGGMKKIAPADVADFLTRTIDQPAYHQRIVGIWQ
jgi:putative NADH-flavin reductase